MTAAQSRGVQGCTVSTKSTLPDELGRCFWHSAGIERVNAILAHHPCFILASG